MRIYSTDEIEQQSPEWFALKDLKLTSSEATAIGNNGKGLDSLCRKLVREHYSSAERNQWTNRDLDRGNELEPVARELYELETGRKIEKVGFIELDNRTGCSTDGLIGEDGVAEIKAPDDATYFKVLMDMEVDSDYSWQVQMELVVTGRNYVDLIEYNPNFEKSMVIFRIYPDLVKQEALRKGIEMGKVLIEKYLALYQDRLKESGPKIIGKELKEEIVIVYEGSKKPRAINLKK